PADVCAKLDADIAWPLTDNAAEKVVNAKITDINTPALSPLLGDPLLLPGALGDRVQVNGQVRISGNGEQMALQADIDAPRLKGAPVAGGRPGGATLNKLDAAKMTWTPSVEWMNKNVFTTNGPDGKPLPSDRLAEEMTFNIDVKSLALASSKKAADGA